MLTEQRMRSAKSIKKALAFERAPRVINNLRQFIPQSEVNREAFHRTQGLISDLKVSWDKEVGRDLTATLSSLLFTLIDIFRMGVIYGRPEAESWKSIIWMMPAVIYTIGNTAYGLRQRNQMRGELSEIVVALMEEQKLPITCLGIRQ